MSRKTITRTDLRRRWGLSTSSLVRREEQGIITPIKAGKYEPIRYSMTEVELAERFKLHEAKRPGRASSKSESAKAGEIVGQAFRMFRAGASLADVVIELNLKPEAVDDLYEQYRDGDLEFRYTKRKMDQDLG